IFSKIFFKASVESRSQTYSTYIDTLSYKSSDRRFNINAARGKITLTGNNLMFQDLEVHTDSTDIRASGQVLFEKRLRWMAAIDAQRFNFTEASSFLGAALTGNISAKGGLEYRNSAISGNLVVSGIFMDKVFDSLTTHFKFTENRLMLDTLHGIILSGCNIMGKADIDFSVYPERYHLIGSINNFNLNNLVPNTYQSNLNGKLNLTGEGFIGENLALDIITDLDESWFDQYHAYKAMGMITVTTDSLIFHDQFAIKYHDNLFVISGKLQYAGGIELSGSTRFDDLSAFNGQIFIDKLGGRADLDFQITGKLSNPDLTGRLNSDSLWLYQVFSSKADIDFRMKHFLYNRTGGVNMNLYQGSAYNVPFDSIRLGMDVDSQMVIIKNADLRSKNASITGIGQLAYTSYPQKLTIDSMALNILGLSGRNDSPIEIDIDSIGYDVKQCRLFRPKGFIEGNGRINYDETMNLEIGIEKLGITPLVKLVLDTMKLEGVMSAHSHLSGSFASPLIDFKGQIDSLKYNYLVLGDLLADFIYADTTVQIDSITINSHTGYYTAKGIFPINLSFLPTKNRFLSLKWIFMANFKLTGTPLKPKIDGHININNGTLKLYDLTLPLENLNLDMRMSDYTIYIEKVSAICKEGKKSRGLLTGEGEIVINSIEQLDYNVKIKVKDFQALYELGDVSALVDADLKIHGITPPTVYGDVKIISASYRENFAKESDGWIILTSLEGDKTWDLNLNVEVGSNLWIKNDDIDAELAGAINFIREKGLYRYIGSMEILRGKGYLADRIFRIEPGATINYEDIESPNPRLDIYATTKIQGAVPTEPQATGVPTYDLRVHITGTLEEPIINAAEGGEGSHQFTTEDIVPLLFSNYYQEGSNSSGWTSDRVGGRLKSGVSGYLSTQVTQIGARTLGVETFEIDPVYGNKLDPLGTTLTLGFYTHPNLYIYGRSAISGVSGREVGFEYRLKRFLLVEGRHDEENLYHLLLNFYWEY
ncbi:MAG: translocation/assembly module TamB domain-containing protein, partial [candidate division Zixibacteria bacterium]|nr:translocation/assembly module TamB domain-containing protein [candidate division Zixibacteria bacterium]